jgi:hypothetical protein
MLAFILAAENAPFVVALGVMAALTLVELVTMLLGFALSGLLDGVMPDLDVDVDVDADLAAPSPGMQVLHWLQFGTAPTLILFGLFLTGFGLAGLLVQSTSIGVTGRLLNPWIAGIPAFFAALLVMRTLGGFLGRTVLRDETSAVSADSLLGTTAVVTLGTTRRSHPSQAKLRDQHGQTHYVLIEPLREGDEFHNGDSVTLIQREGPKYLVIESSVDALLNLGSDDLPAEIRQKA